jgi:hypothetical protein
LDKRRAIKRELKTKNEGGKDGKEGDARVFVETPGFRVQGLGFRVYGSGFRVWGSG